MEQLQLPAPDVGQQLLLVRGQICNSKQTKCLQRYIIQVTQIKMQEWPPPHPNQQSSLKRKKFRTKTCLTKELWFGKCIAISDDGQLQRRCEITGREGPDSTAARALGRKARDKNKLSNH